MLCMLKFSLATKQAQHGQQLSKLLWSAPWTCLTWTRSKNVSSSVFSWAFTSLQTQQTRVRCAPSHWQLCTAGFATEIQIPYQEPPHSANKLTGGDDILHRPRSQSVKGSLSKQSPNGRSILMLSNDRAKEMTWKGKSLFKSPPPARWSVLVLCFFSQWYC